MNEDLFRHHAFLDMVAEEDIRFLKEKDRSYGASWKLAGGRSAWFMLRRKMDRMIQIMRRPDPPPNFHINPTLSGEDLTTREAVDYLKASYLSEDVFAKIEEDPSGKDGCVLAEIRDLRRYLLLVEAEMVSRGVVIPPVTEEELRARGSYLKDKAVAKAPSIPSSVAESRSIPRKVDGMEHPYGYDADGERMVPHTGNMPV